MQVLKWNGNNNWTVLGGPVSGVGANTMCSDPWGNLYVGSGTKVMKWNGSAWSELAGLNPNGMIRTICRDAFGNIYAAGEFKMNSSFYSVAKWNGSSWSNTGFQGNAIIYSLTSDAYGNVFAGGNFSNGSNSTSGYKYVAKYNGSSWSSLGNGFANGQINSICCDASGAVYAAGRFKNGAIKYYVAKWNGTTWIEVGGANNLNANEEINSIHIDQTGNIYAGGRFNNLTGSFRYVARFLQTVGSNELDFVHVEVSPNPANDIMNLICSDKLINENIKIVDLSGKVVFDDIIKNQEFQIEINFPPGQYTLWIKNSVNQKIIVY
jgi:hypothetical protein